VIDDTAHQRLSRKAIGEALAEAVIKPNPHMIVVVEGSYPTTINWEPQDGPAIIWTTHAGQKTGHASADVISGGQTAVTQAQNFDAYSGTGHVHTCTIVTAPLAVVRGLQGRLSHVRQRRPCQHFLADVRSQ
jgi:hypothetical protein